MLNGLFWLVKQLARATSDIASLKRRRRRRRLSDLSLFMKNFLRHAIHSGWKYFPSFHLLFHSSISARILTSVQLWNFLTFLLSRSSSDHILYRRPAGTQQLFGHQLMQILAQAFKHVLWPGEAGRKLRITGATCSVCGSENSDFLYQYFWIIVLLFNR